MTTFTTFSRPAYDAGARTNYRLPPRLLRPVIAALVCRRKGHRFDGHGTADGTWHDEGCYDACSRCAMRRFKFAPSKEWFDELMLKEKRRWKQIMVEDDGSPI